MINTLKVTGRDARSLKVVVAGAGAAGYQCTRLMSHFGLANIIVCDTRGAIHAGREFADNPAKSWLARHTNPEGLQGSLREVLRGADIFLGLSAPGLIHRDDVATMNPDPILFAMSNPTPEIMPEEAEGLAAVIATGRSDYANQINNVLAFPGIFRGALDVRASQINDAMKQAAAFAIAEVISQDELSPDYIIPSAFNRKVYKQVAAAVARAAHKSGVARRMPRGIDLHA